MNRDWLMQEAVSFEERRADVADLVLFGLMTGAWPAFEDGVRRRVARERRIPAVTPEALSARITQFRIGRQLLSSDEMAAWLHERALSAADLAGVLGRAVLQEREGDAGDEDGLDATIADERVGAVLRAEGLCANCFDTLARELTDRLTAAHRLDRLDARVTDERVTATLSRALARPAAGLAALGERVLAERLERLWAYEDALAELRAEASEPSRLERRLAGHGLDWLRLEGRRLSFAHEDAAREARLLLVSDGLTVEAVSEVAGVAATVHSLYVDEAPATVAGHLAATAIGEIAGPWPQGEEWHLLAVSAKISPSGQDSVLRERAAQELLDEVLRRQATGRARRHLVL